MTTPERQTIESIASGNSAVPRPPRKWLLRIGLPFLLLACAAGVLIATSWQALMPATTVTATIVAVRSIETNEPADRAEGGGIVQAPGWIEPDPFSTYVAALTSGTIKEILVLEGDSVEVGQVVATLVDDDARIATQRAKAKLAQRNGELAGANAALKAAQTDRTELVAVRRRVSVADAEVAKLNAELIGFTSSIASKEATRDAIKDEYVRKAGLVEEGAVAAGPWERLGIQLRAVTADLDGLAAQQDAAKAKLAAAAAEANAAKRDRELLVRETLAVERTQAAVDVAKASIAHAEADLADAELALERTQIVSPVAGIVIERLTSTGSIIRFQGGEHAAHVLHVYDPAHLQVRADIPLADAAKVGVGQEAEILLDLLPDTVFKGEVTRFVHRADIAKNTVEAKVRIFDPSPLLKPDMLARVRILPMSDDAEGEVLRTVDRVFIPVAALDGGLDHVWVIENRNRDRGTARRRAVRLGPAVIDAWREVVDGLKPGDAVITGKHDLADGALVEIAQPNKGVPS